MAIIFLILQKAYCEPCWLFANPASKNTKCLDGGYDDWKHIVDAIERHETSKIHLDSCLINSGGYKKNLSGAKGWRLSLGGVGIHRAVSCIEAPGGEVMVSDLRLHNRSSVAPITGRIPLWFALADSGRGSCPMRLLLESGGGRIAHCYAETTVAEELDSNFCQGRGRRVFNSLWSRPSCHIPSKAFSMSRNMVTVYRPQFVSDAR
ncbi:hypothetical protein EVAR_1010_1 [Eumeta japonica]|uniref:Uncharacterized protein n=1 Tax=Eumeta variegata TaxID=151549 RepID=A0A4C1SGI5_EUMVA|nr:hypothetical protein EVAR_1010_1 [Eumeta japonica]